MTKYIDAEKLRAEIERLEAGCSFREAGAYKRMYRIIDSLQQEQPEVDLEKEIDDYFCSIERWQVEEEPYRQLDKCALHFYRLGLNARKEGAK